MAVHSRVRVYVACSVDGFIAGPDDDLSWLPSAEAESESGRSAPLEALLDNTRPVGFEAFMHDVGALLMGRRTYDVVAGFAGAWPYGDRPVLVATHRPLEARVSSARTVRGEITDLVNLTREAAHGRDVYVDGGQMIRQALDAGLVDELIVTLVPVLLGKGRPLFAGVEQRHGLEFLAHHPFGSGMLQVRARPARTGASGR